MRGTTTHKITWTEIVTLILAYLFMAASGALAAYKDGVCVDDDTTYCIETIEELQAVTDNLDKNCYLMNDIETSATETASFNGDLGFLPIGVTYDTTADLYETSPFSGTFNGNGFTISGLTIDTAGAIVTTGLFGTVGPDATDVLICDLTLENIIIKGDSSLGALAGALNGNKTAETILTVRDCRIDGAESMVSGSGQFVGGMFGWIDSHSIDRPVTIKNCSGNIQVYGTSYVGGLAGTFYYSAMENCSSSVKVIGSDYTGGMVGYVWGSKIVNCRSRGTVIAESESGGFVGQLNGNSILSDSSFKGSVHGISSIGGMIGTGSFEDQISNCVSSADVKGDESVGGFAGGASSDFQRCLSSGTLKGKSSTGGFVGKMAGPAMTTDCMSTVDVKGDFQSGGFAGSVTDQGSLTRCYSKGAVSGGAVTGGLIGFNDSVGQGVQSSYWDMESSGKNTSEGGEGLSSADMMQSASFTGWDFGSTWGILAGSTRPYLELPFSTSNLALDVSSPALQIEDGGTITLNVTVTNMGEYSAETVTLTALFDTGITETRYTADGGKNWQELDETVVLDGALDVGISITVQIQGTIHGSTGDEAGVKCGVDLEGLDVDLADNSAALSWTIGPGTLEKGEGAGGDGSGCFIGSVLRM